MADPRMLGPYRLERVLGTGSFATVWLAHDEVLDRRVAVKILADNWSQDAEVRRRFLSEARVLLTAESPRIVRGFHLGETPTGQPYLVMAWADRGTLGDRIVQRQREGRTFDTLEAVALAAEIVAALVDVHDAGHLHRDVKPTNVLIRSSSTLRHTPGLAADETVVLADFGLARGLEMTSLTLVAGSPGYVAPEQASGLTQLDRRADLYSIGRILLELLTGDPGGRATTMAGAAAERIDVGEAIAAMPATARPPEQLVTLVTRLVAERPDDRPSTAEEIVAELGAVRRNLGAPAAGGAGPPLVPPTAPPPGEALPDGARQLTGTQLAAPAPRAGGLGGLSSRTKALIAGAAVAIVVLIGVVIALAGGGGGGDADTTTTTLLDSVGLVTTTTSGPTTAPVVVLASTEVQSAPRSSPATTEPATTEPATTEPATTEPATTAPATTAPASTTAPRPTVIPDAQRLTLDPAAIDSVPTASVADAEPGNVETGLWFGTPATFLATVIEQNPAWTIDPDDLATVVDDTETADVEFSGPDGWTATVHLEPGAVTSGAAITEFVVVYH